MTRQEYIEQSLLRLLHTWTNFALLSGTIIILGLAPLDLAVIPENLTTFVLYRVTTAAIILLTYLFNKRKISWKRLTISLLIATVSVSTMVALMIARYGGHTSPYYGGIILTLIFVLTVSPPIKRLEFLSGLLYAAIIYGLYVIPITIYDTITNRAFFINANFFIIASAISLIFIRHFIIKRLRNEFSLQYDLEQQKKQLSLYSDELKKDVTNKEAALVTSELRFKELFENANDGIIVMNRNGIIIDVNRKFSEITGFDRNSLIGTNIKILEVGGDKEESINRRERVLKGESVIFEMEHFRKDGEKIELEVSSKAINTKGEVYIQSFYRDITEKKRLQAQLFQAQKMESIGILAGGIAHDFDNIITSIISNIEMLKNHTDLDKKGRQRVNIIENSARRANTVIARLLSFARMEAFDKKTVDLNMVIKETIDLLSSTLIKRRIEVTMNLDDGSLVEGDNNLLSQAIMNIIINAVDAMPSGGRITISTSTRMSGGQLKPLLEEGEYVMLEFSDTGMGFSPEIKDRIFEPFFTTKGSKGTGLGLSIVYRIIKEHKGAITVESQPGKGTTFYICLPAAGKNQSDGKKFKLLPARLLVVDDEVEVIDMIKNILESQGYEVHTLHDPLLAYEMDKEMIKEIDMLITDIMMPHMNGKELIRYFKALKPSMKVIAISAHDIWNIGKRDGDIDVYISKPFNSVYLLSVVRRVLDSETRFVTQ